MKYTLVYNVHLRRKTAIITDMEEQIAETFIQIPERIDDYLVTDLGDNLFYNNQTLQEIWLPSSIRSIGTQAFLNCNNLKNVLMYDAKVPHKSITINKEAFAFCSQLTRIILSPSKDVWFNDGYAFKNCHKLMILTGKIHTVWKGTFFDCFELDRLTFANNTYWQDGAFKRCKNLKHITCLGNIDIGFTKKNLALLKKMKITCQPNTNIAELAYDGYDIRFEADSNTTSS